MVVRGSDLKAAVDASEDSREEWAARIGVSLETLRRWAKLPYLTKNQLNAIRGAGLDLQIATPDIDRRTAEHKTRAT